METFANYWYHQHNSHHWHVGGGWIALIILIVLLLLAFEIWMIVDCITNKKVPTPHKAWWIIGIFLIHPIVAIIYFFVSRLHYNKLPRAKAGK